MDLALALRRLGDVQPFQEEATRLSQLATGNVDEGERRQAIRQLGRFEADELRPVFEQALRDTDRRVRREAEEALEELDESRDRRGR
jgi:HEAT repeat protein